MADKICREEFGLDLADLQRTLRMRATKMENKLGQLSHLQLKAPTARIEFGSALIRDMLNISKHSTDILTQALITMHSTIIHNSQARTDTLNKELASATDALRNLELEKVDIEAAAHIKFEQDKALLKASLCEELQACQICQANPRNVLIVPCFHGQYCGDCLETYQKSNKTCPTCRGVIRGTLPYIA